MIRFSQLPAVLLVGVVLVATARPGFGDDETSAADATKPGSPSITVGVQFDADYSSAAGASLTTTNGRNQQTEGDLDGMYSAYGSVPEGQFRLLTLRVTEDSTVNGPDDKPGVLRLQFVEVPLKTSHSGFLISGSQEHGKMQMRGWTPGEVTLADLRRTFVEFKFRADNSNDPADFGGMYAFRFEPQLPDSYGRRAEFGVLIATQRWRTFRRPIGSASNLDAFLKTVNEEQPSHFKLVWSQHGPIQGYTAGDSLLIDDLKIVIE